jgi:hypothetical protein
MKWFRYLVFSLLFPLVFAQGRVQGTISANEVSGFSVIACYADAEVGCNESLSSVTEITTTGTSASYSLENLSAGQYIIFLWRDSNKSGELEEDQDEISYYATANEEVTLVSPPAQTIDFNVSSTTLAANPIANPIANPTSSQDITGSWSNYGYLGNYLNGNVTANLDFLDSSKAQSFIFNADGTYNSLDYNLMYDAYTGSYIACIWTRLNGTYVLQGDQIITTVLTEESARCGLEFAAMTITCPTRTFVWRFEQNGLGLLDTSELSTIDDTSWISGYATHLSRDN